MKTAEKKYTKADPKLMTFSEFESAVLEAQETEARAEDMVRRMARMCSGRLRSARVDVHVLSALKRELNRWDIRKRKWK